MNSIEIFTMALGLQQPWSVTKVEFVENSDSGIKELHLWLDFEKGHKFVIGESEPQTAYDTLDKTWRHLDFFQHHCYLHARVPRIRVSDNSVKMVEVPWARQDSGFTLLFEAYAMLLIEKEMPVNSVARTTKVTAPRIWRVFSYWVKRAVDKIDMSGVRRIGVDETSKRKGHDYVTQFVDLDKRSAIYVTEGRGAETFREFKEELVKRNGKEENISAISMDMSPSFISGATTYFPKAAVVFDKFHIYKALSECFDTVRKQEHDCAKLLKGHRFTLLHKKSNLSDAKKAELETLLLTYPTIGKAYGFRESFMDIFEERPQTKEAVERIEKWCEKVLEASIAPMAKFVAMVRAHMFGIKTMFEHQNVNNGILEGLNSLVQLAKKRARGFASAENFKYMIYFCVGKLKLDYPHDSL